MNSSLKSTRAEKTKTKPKKLEPVVPLVDRINDVLNNDAELRRHILECCDKSFSNQPPVNTSHKLYKRKSPVTPVAIVKRH